MENRLNMIYVCVLMLVLSPLTNCNPIDNGQQKTETLKFKNIKSKYDDDISALREELDSLRSRVAKLEMSQKEPTDVEVQPITDDLSSQIHHVITKRAFRRRRKRVPETAFQATLSHESATFKLYDAIIFNDVFTNIGGAYNKHNGIFTAPFAGTYSFYTNIVSEKGHYVEASIQVNGKPTVSAISDHRSSSNKDFIDIWDQGNAVAILRLRKDDKVSVNIQWPEGSHAVHGVGKSSFSGYLMRAHELN